MTVALRELWDFDDAAASEQRFRDLAATADEPLATYAALDEHALKAPPEAEKSVEALARYLVEPAKNDREKARVIFRWITDRIRYDTESFFKGKVTDGSAAACRLASASRASRLFSRARAPSR